MAQAPNFRANAAQCRADAEAATLSNVRERCLRAEAAWLDMADRQERVETARAVRENRPGPATIAA
ncbi:hypothetical protein [Sphingomonas sp. dw_22]|uniref:hypothetical protein n=1 Tax=Sphingomonas sp. dw_22 TaxID=2721175 RepID=UPI001BD69A9D|nr:hypothetical protein [Sphingomonas sp. dw_22]